MKDKDLTLDDLIYLAQDDPLASKTQIEAMLGTIKKEEYSSGYNAGWKQGSQLGSYIQPIIGVLVLLGTMFTIWKVHDNLSWNYERLLATELLACKEGKTAECLAASTRANGKGEFRRQELYSKVYFDATKASLPGSSNLSNGFADLEYDSAGNLVIKLNTARTLVVKP